MARAARATPAATHALAVLIDLDEGADRIEFGGTICLAIATAEEVASRRTRILGGREWVRLGAVEMGLDCLRRYLQGLPVTSGSTSRRCELGNSFFASPLPLRGRGRFAKRTG